MNKYWYKNAVIYSLDVESYLDYNGDGIGDFSGLMHSLKYLSSLGVNCLWLLPFYSSPNKDNGYDISDYYTVDHRLGNLGDFAELLEVAEELGIRVLIDLVVNHTSDQHYWFQHARKNKNSRYRDYYIWMDEKPEESGEYVIFGEDQGGSNWAYDEEAGAYYYHTFYTHQPDLNLANPEVRREIRQIMRFWLRLGVSGFRMDAVPHMIREKGKSQFEENSFHVLEDFREFVQNQRKDAILLAEVDVDPQKYEDYFGDDNRMHMLFNFYVNNNMYLSLARQKADPLKDALGKMHTDAQVRQLANFLRNHDELDLERLTNEEREEVYAAFAPEENMRIYDRGVRRRLAPMLGNDRKKIEFAYSLMLSLPGTPVLRYGQEIGMGEDLSLEGRSSVRTVMQWTDRQSGGFSTAPADKLVRPVVTEGEFSYHKVNVNEQQRDPNSLVNWFKRMIHFRKSCPEFGQGHFKVLETGHEEVLIHYCTYEGNVAMALHNFSEKPLTVTINLEDVQAEHLVDLCSDQQYDNSDLESGKFHLNGYGYRWFRSNNVQL